MYKLMIIDDEKYVRSSIKNKIDWQNIPIVFCAEASNGYEALEQIEVQHPDIVLCDMFMENMDGVELTQRIHASYPEIKIIIISGYDRYEYTRSAITNKAEDYILKPVNSGVLNNALQKCVTALEKTQQDKQNLSSLRMTAQNNLQSSRTYFLNRLLFDPLFSDDIIIKTMRSHDVQIDYTYFCVYVYAIPNLQGMLEKKFQNNIEELDLEIRRVCGEKENLFITRNLNKNYEWILILGYHFQVEKQKIMNDLSVLKDRLETFLELPFSGGVGQLVHGFRSIHESYSQAALACRSMSNGSFSALSHFDDWQYTAESYIAIDKYISETNVIAFYIRNNNQEKISTALGAFFDQITSASTVSLDHIVFYCYELLSMLDKELAKSGIDFYPIFHQNMYSFEALYACQSIQQIRQKLDQALRKTAEVYHLSHSSDNSSVVERAKHYINANFNHHLTLDQIASEFFINKIYFLRLFKAETGKTFIQYLTNLRMQKARDYLKDPQVKIKDVAYLVGYDDYRYFSKLYKKHFGELPSSVNQ